MLRRAAVTILLLWCASLPARAQSLSGISVGENVAATSRLGLPPIEKNEMGPFTVQKWRQPDGNELSVTAERDTGRIVYAETDWGGNREGAFSDFRGFLFGRTSLSDIRRALGSNGFAFKDRGPAVATAEGIVLFNAYEVEGRPEIIVVFATRVKREDAKRAKDIGNIAKLEAIIVGNREYLDTLWGAAKSYDNSYRKIRWP